MAVKPEAAVSSAPPPRPPPPQQVTKTIGDVYRERRRSQFMQLELQIARQKQADEKRQQEAAESLRQLQQAQPQPQPQSHAEQENTSWGFNRLLAAITSSEGHRTNALGDAASAFLHSLQNVAAGSRATPSSKSHVLPQKSPRVFKKSFTLRVGVLSAKGLQVRTASNKVHGYLAILEQKVYADLSVMPHSSCGVYCRTGGQPRSPNVIFREEFIFKNIEHTAQALMVVLTLKSAMDTKSLVTHVGYCVVALDKIQFAMSNGDTVFLDWFPLYDRSGAKISKAFVQLSLELTVASV
jgi:hypothetical protein